MDIYETPIVTYENTRPIQFRETKSPQSRTPTVPPMILKDYKTPRWMVKAMLGIAALIVVMLAGIVVGIVMITKEREEITQMRNGQQALAKQNSDSGKLAQQQDARIVSLEKILTTVQQAHRKLGQDYSGLERILTTVNTSLQQAQRKLGQDVRAIACNIWYRGKCYLPLKKLSNHASASKLCKEFGGGLANIYSSTHLTRIMDSIRQTKMNGLSTVDFYLGMKIVPSNESVTLSDGAPAQNLKWGKNYPLTDSSRTCLWLRVNRGSSSTDQYLRNVHPRYSAFVLCEIA